MVRLYEYSIEHAFMLSQFHRITNPFNDLVWHSAFTNPAVCAYKAHLVKSRIYKLARLYRVEENVCCCTERLVLDGTRRL